jgi:polyisoprenyl-teichoic acid--peptidoglycan teichoic acid transferase
MVYLKQETQAYNRNSKANGVKFYKKMWFRISAFLLLILLIGGGILAWKTDSVMNKITGGGLLSSLMHNIPGVSEEVKGQKDGRINILLLGMRGENVPGGGTLADTIILASIKLEADKKQNKVSMISIPRDLYVTVPGTSDKQKINAVHAYGEQKGKGQGLQDMKTIISEVTGLPIHYAVSTNFEGFKRLVDAVGGIEVVLDKPFEESLQFNEPHVCDSQIFTEPTGQYEYKKHTTRTGKVKIVAQYPLCTNPDKECGGDFKLPPGKQTLNGQQALCYARSRVTSNDFERAKRQQLMLQLVKNKMLSVGTLTDFSKVNGIMNALGDNVRTDMQSWEIQKLYDIAKDMTEAKIYQRVLENNEEGLLYYPGESAAGYILLPIGDNYDKIRDMAVNIFTLPEQSDIKPK